MSVLPALPSAPALERLSGNDLMFCVPLMHKSGLLDRNEAFGSRINSVAMRTLKAYVVPTVSPVPPYDPVLGQEWWHSKENVMRIFVGPPVNWQEQCCPRCGYPKEK